LYTSVDPYNQPVGVRRYQIRKKIFSFANMFTIKDEQDQATFTTVRGKTFSLSRKLTLEDMVENEDQAFILALVIVINQVLGEKQEIQANSNLN